MVWMCGLSMRLQQFITKCVIALMLILSASFGITASASQPHNMPADMRSHCTKSMPTSPECCTSMLMQDIAQMDTASRHATNAHSNDSCCDDMQCQSHHLNFAILADTITYHPLQLSHGFAEPVEKQLTNTEFIFRPPVTC